MRLPKILKNKKGFTLIELLVVIGILAILLVITIIAVNPPRQLGQARDTQRRSDVLAILNAVSQYYADNGELPAGIDDTVRPIADVVTDPDGADICDSIATPPDNAYLTSMPFDPTADGAGYTSCTTYNTDYTIMADANDRVTVSATGEIDTSISVTR